MQDAKLLSSQNITGENLSDLGLAMTFHIQSTKEKMVICTSVKFVKSFL